MEQLRTISIILTESCNLNCVYCYEKYKSPRKMSAQEAIRILDQELTDDNGYDKVVVHLFGGEPFLAFPVLKEIVEYLRVKQYPKKLQLFTTTNGTLVHGSIQQWLKKQAPFFICGLSLDGTREVHNLNRSNSFDDIDLAFFRDTYPKQPIKMTISQNTLAHLSESIIFCHEQGFLVSCNLAYNIDWSNKSNTQMLESELLKLINYYLSHPNIEPCSMLNLKISRVATTGAGFVPKWCGAGINTCAYGVDGRKYACQFFSPVSMGEQSREIDQQLTFYDHIPDKLIDDKCRNCVVRAICPTCYGANYASTGNLYHKDENYCKLTKIIIKAISFYKAKLWQLGRLNLPKEEELKLLKSIEIIQKNLYYK